MIPLVLATGLTVISVSTVPPTPSSWTCAYVAERLPRALSLLGDDTVSAEETWAARKRLSLSDSVLTRASSLALARALGATRLMVIRCLDQDEGTTIEAQSFDAERPLSRDPVRISRSRREIPAAIDELARRLVPAAEASGLAGFRAPSERSLSLAGPALARSSAEDRARGLIRALDEDPGSIDLRLATVDALLAARDLEAAVRLASRAPDEEVAPPLARWLRFQAGAAQLEAGRYAEAGDTFEALRPGRETAAVLNNLGVARFRLRDPNASGLFERAARFVDHRQTDISFNRSLALLFEGKAEVALPSLEASLQARPADVRTRLLRVWALGLMNREAERGEEWERLLALAPSFTSLARPDLARRLERIFFSERSPES